MIFSVLFLPIVFLIHLFSLFKYEKWIIPNNEILIVVLLIFIFYSLTIIITRPLRSEILQGYKLIESKIIESKYDFIDKQDRFSSEFRKYVIIADAEKFIVTEDQYKGADINDLLVIHMTPLRKMRLKIKIEKNTRA
jgi:hypothetical protein